MNVIYSIIFYACIKRNLISIPCYRYHGVIHLIPILLYSNVYSTTPLLRKLADSQEIQEECAKYVSRLGRKNNKNNSYYSFFMMVLLQYDISIKNCLLFYILFIIYLSIYLFSFLFSAYSPILLLK
jgi:hypothetical protein